MSPKVVNKKIIVTANCDGLTEAELGKLFNKLQNGGANNCPAGLVLNPTPAAVETKITARTALYTTRSGLEAQMKQNTKDIHTADSGLKTIFTDQWANEIQNFAGITVNQIEGMGFGIKGLEPQGLLVMDAARTATSAPVIIRIEIDIKGQHTLHVHNNITGKIGHPSDVLRVDIYGQTGGTAPTSLATLIANGGGWLGSCKRGKYVNTFTVSAANQGKSEFYIAVYILKSTGKPAAQSVVESASIE